MFKDYSRYLRASLYVYIFVLLIIFIMKIVGLDWFGLDIGNPFVIKASNFIKQNMLVNNLLLFFPLLLNQYVIISFTCNDNSKNMFKYNVILIPIFCVLQGFKIDLFGNWSVLVETLYVLFASLVYCKIFKLKFSIKRFIFIMALVLITQIISIMTRYGYTLEYIQNPFANFILNLDYIMMLLIIYKLNFMKGGNNLWVAGSRAVQCSSSQKKRPFSNLLKKWQANYSNFKKISKQDKAAIIIYFVLSLIWNIFTLVVVLFIGKLNGTFIECVFIITSFWLSKKIFGKPFHLESMAGCFAISNITYYILNRLTTPIGISVVVPVMLGVGLSYITSKLVKKAKPLYKGMPEDDFENSILKVADKNSIKYKICYDFYINKENAISLGYKYHYTEAGIRKIASRINDKIKAL